MRAESRVGRDRRVPLNMWQLSSHAIGIASRPANGLVGIALACVLSNQTTMATRWICYDNTHWQMNHWDAIQAGVHLWLKWLPVAPITQNGADYGQWNSGALVALIHLVIPSVFLQYRKLVAIKLNMYMIINNGCKCTAVWKCFSLRGNQSPSRSRLQGDILTPNKCKEIWLIKGKRQNLKWQLSITPLWVFLQFTADR